MKINQPSYWKPEYPAYYSPQGWELEKAIALRIMTLRIRFDRYTRMLDKAREIFMVAVVARDYKLSKRYYNTYCALYNAIQSIGVTLIKDFNQPVYAK